MDRLFPFRSLIGDTVHFLARSWSRGGPIAYYAYGSAQLDAAIAQRGYYFIAGQSHFPDHRLPADFHLPSDSKTRVLSRRCSMSSPGYKRLKKLQAAAKFKVLFVPGAERVASWGKPHEPSKLVNEFQGSFIEIVGPDYWLFANQYFSDPVHLNPSGARKYTERLWELLEGELLADPGAH
jgi:hypothetical protein